MSENYTELRVEDADHVVISCGHHSEGGKLELVDRINEGLHVYSCPEDDCDTYVCVGAGADSTE